MDGLLARAEIGAALRMANRIRDLALFGLAITSCDLIKLCEWNAYARMLQISLSLKGVLLSDELAFVPGLATLHR